MGVTTIYTGTGAPVNVAGHDAITIATPPGQTSPCSPTGDVFNIAGTGFNITSGGVTGSSEQALADIERRYPARHYVLIDDKLGILHAVN